TIVRVNEKYGLFINIGIGVDALCTNTQLDKPVADYQEGGKIDVKVLNVDVGKEQVEVTTRPLASEAKVGDTVEGTVVTQIPAGVFFDAGFSRDLLCPTNFLSKPKEEYSRGEVADLTIMQVDGDRVTVSDKKDVGKPIGSFVRGQEVSGKVVRYTEGLGIFLDVGASREALWRTKGPGATVLPKDAKEYAQGEEVSGLIITRLDVQTQTLEVAMPGAELLKTSLSMENMEVGQEVSGKVAKTMAFGVFVDIGAERDALYAISQLDKPLGDYKVGDELEGLRVVEVDATRQRLAVSTRPLAADFEEGQEVTGKVSKIMDFGLFVDIGASVDALLPTGMLAKDTGEYSEGEVLDDLKVSRVDIQKNQIAVGQKSGGMSSGASLEIDSLEVGAKVPGVVRGIREYGIFVDIGLGRTDALMPNSMLGDVTSAAFKPNQKIEVWIAQVDSSNNRVTVSAVEPTAEMRQRRGRGGGSAGASLDSYIPQGFMIPDPKRHAEIIGREDLMDPEPIPWYEWAEKYPGFIRFQEKDQVITISVRAHGFYGEKELRHSQPAFIPIPAHLQKADAKQPTKDDLRVKYEDQPMPNYDNGIKPEIHIKYRQPPLNDPNWREYPVPDRQPITMDFKADLMQGRKAMTEISTFPQGRLWTYPAAGQTWPAVAESTMLAMARLLHSSTGEETRFGRPAESATPEVPPAKRARSTGLDNRPLQALATNTSQASAVPAPVAEYKLVLLGDAGVGKTSFVKRHLTGEFVKKYRPTEGCEMKKLKFMTSRGPVVFQVWDTAGQDHLAGLRDGYFIGAQCALVFFDVTKRESHQNLSKWVMDLRKVAGDIPVVVVGNKVDAANRVVKAQEGSLIMRKLKVQYYDLSVRTRFNTEAPLLFLSKRLMGDSNIRLIPEPGSRPPELALPSAAEQRRAARELTEALNVPINDSDDDL
ncbi:unnamed protein product, partial [Symbiodinium pilosum]